MGGPREEAITPPVILSRSHISHIKNVNLSMEDKQAGRVNLIVGYKRGH